MTKPELRAIARGAAINHGIDPDLVCAVCEHESSWDVNAQRYEPAFFERYISHMFGLSPEEAKLRATSIGLMQIMGQVAREQGFDGGLKGLFEPLANVTQGCRKLRRCLERENGDVRAALLRYNGGGAPSYPDLVLQFMPKGVA